MASRSTKKRSKEPTTVRAPARTQKRPKSTKLLVLVASFCALLAVGWWTGAFGNIPLLMARRAMVRHDDDSASKWLQWSAKFNGDAAEVQMLMARIERRRSEFDQMLIHLKQATQLGVDRERVQREEVLAAAQTGQLEQIEPQLKAWLAKADQDAIEICDAYINGLTMVGRLDDAEVLLKAWQADAPTDPEPHFRRGRIKEHLRFPEEAEQEYREALSKDPSYPPALYALGRLLLDRKRPEEALPFFRACEEHAPAAAVAAQVGRAMCLRSLGQVAEARHLLQRLVQLPVQDRQQAYTPVRERPQIDIAAFELGKLESAEGNYEVAEKWLRQTVEGNPRDLDARYAWAVSLRGLGRSADAQREFEHVTRVREILAETDHLYDRLAENPEDIEARYKMGVAYLQYRSEPAGLYWLQSVLNYDDNHRPTHQALADYYRDHAKDSTAYANLAEFHRQKIEQINQNPP